MSNKEKFLSLVSDEPCDTVEKNRLRIKNRNYIRKLQKRQILKIKIKNILNGKDK